MLWIPELHLTSSLKQPNTVLGRQITLSCFVPMSLIAAQLCRSTAYLSMGQYIWTIFRKYGEIFGDYAWLTHAMIFLLQPRIYWQSVLVIVVLIPIATNSQVVLIKM